MAAAASDSRSRASSRSAWAANSASTPSPVAARASGCACARRTPVASPRRSHSRSSTSIKPPRHSAATRTCSGRCSPVSSRTSRTPPIGSAPCSRARSSGRHCGCCTRSRGSPPVRGWCAAPPGAAIRARPQARRSAPAAGVQRLPAASARCGPSAVRANRYRPVQGISRTSQSSQSSQSSRARRARRGRHQARRTAAPARSARTPARRQPGPVPALQRGDRGAAGRHPLASRLRPDRRSNRELRLRNRATTTAELRQQAPAPPALTPPATGPAKRLINQNKE